MSADNTLSAGSSTGEGGGFTVGSLIHSLLAVAQGGEGGGCHIWELNTFSAGSSAIRGVTFGS